MSFIGIAINIWKDTGGTGGGGIPSTALRQRNNDLIYTRSGQLIYTGTRQQPTLPQIFFNGDSLTFGTMSTGGLDYPTQLLTLLGGASNFSAQNWGIAASLMSGMASRAAIYDTYVRSYLPANLSLEWAGDNNINIGEDGTTVYNNYVTYMNNRIAAGLKPIAFTILPRTTANPNYETERQIFNNLVRTNYNSFSYGLVDVGNDSTVIGYPGAQLDLTYYSFDQLHLVNAGYGVVAQYALPVVQALL